MRWSGVRPPCSDGSALRWFAGFAGGCGFRGRLWLGGCLWLGGACRAGGGGFRSGFGARLAGGFDRGGSRVFQRLRGAEPVVAVLTCGTAFIQPKEKAALAIWALSIWGCSWGAPIAVLELALTGLRTMLHLRNTVASGMRRRVTLWHHLTLPKVRRLVLTQTVPPRQSRGTEVFQRSGCRSVSDDP